MEKDLTLDIKIPNSKKCQCFKCKYNGGSPSSCSCMKYRLKPSGILYENEKCPKFVEDNEEEEED